MPRDTGELVAIGSQVLSPAEYLATAATWSDESPVPRAQVTRLALELGSLRALSSVRRQVRAFLESGLPESVSEATAEDAVDRSILVIDELASNALRHGRAPPELHVVDEVDQWVVIVTDSSPEQSPTPAQNRPAGAGGYGLYVVADLSAQYGVHYETHRKMVWAVLGKPSG